MDCASSRMASPRANPHADQSVAGDDLVSLKALLDNASDAVALFDRDLRHVYVNAATGRANNRPVKDFIGKTMRDLGHTEVVSEQIESHLRKVFFTAAETTFNLEFSGPWGRKDYQCRMTPEIGRDGGVENVIVISRDITAERQAEEKLAEARRLSTLSRLAQELAHQINNPLQALRNTLYLVQRGPAPEQLQAYLSLAQELLGRMESLVQTMLVLRESDLEAPTGEDLSATITRVRQLHQVAQHVMGIAESSQFAITAIDLRGIITIWNRAAVEFYGYTAAEAIGQPLVAITGKGREAEVAGLLDKIRNGIPIAPFETVRAAKTGKTVHLRMHVSPIYDLNGNPVGASGIGALLDGAPPQD